MVVEAVKIIGVIHCDKCLNHASGQTYEETKKELFKNVLFNFPIPGDLVLYVLKINVEILNARKRCLFLMCSAMGSH